MKRLWKSSNDLEVKCAEEELIRLTMMLPACLWAILYELTCIILGIISTNIHVSQWLKPLALLIYILLLLFWIFVTGRNESLGLCPLRYYGWTKYLHMFLLFTLPLFNIVIGKDFRIVFSTVVYMAIISFIEEVLFRGFILHYFLKRSRWCGIFVSSGMFAVFHFLNLAQNDDFLYVSMQVLSALAVGVCYSAIAVLYDSLLPCIIAHFLTNVTGVSASTAVSINENTLVLWICIVIYSGYGIFLCRKIQ